MQSDWQPDTTLSFKLTHRSFSVHGVLRADSSACVCQDKQNKKNQNQTMLFFKKKKNDSVWSFVFALENCPIFNDLVVYHSVKYLDIELKNPICISNHIL